MNGDIRPTPPPRSTAPQAPTPTAEPKPTPLLAEPEQPELIPAKLPRKRRRLVWILLGAAAGIVIAVVATFLWYTSSLSAPDSSDKSRVRVEIVAGSTPSAIADTLKNEGVIRSSLAFTIYARLHGVQSTLQAGTYSLSKSESVEEIVKHLTAGNTDTFDITFLPGATVADNKKAFLKAGYDSAEIDAAFAKTYDSPLFTDKPASADLEGYIFGETYKFATSATVEDILERTFQEFETQLEKYQLVDGFKRHGLNQYQGIILASIIQREVNGLTDQKQVAQVFYIRLELGMMLGSDVTYQYAADKLGVERDYNLDSPYNTRRYTGLPPGPISVPGLTALQAVADPAAGDYLFFLSGDDDKTYFAKTDAEHTQNIQQHCQKKCQII